MNDKTFVEVTFDTNAFRDLVEPHKRQKHDFGAYEEIGTVELPPELAQPLQKGADATVLTMQHSVWPSYKSALNGLSVFRFGFDGS